MVKLELGTTTPVALTRLCLTATTRDTTSIQLTWTKASA